MKDIKSILITGGAGFVGSNLAVSFKRDFPEKRLVAFDNLKRSGSHLNLERLKKAGIEFIHGDIRNPEDLKMIPHFDLLIECSAEPSVQAGLNGDPDYLVHTNLFGTYHCLEVARKCKARIVFLSTSRVYSINAINSLNFKRGKTRFDLDLFQSVPGISERGISENFSTQAPLSLYGATKLASEILLLEYVHQFGLCGVINRCSILTGPWQMGKVDQGVAVLWAAAHLYGRPLKYLGYGGSGFQVRDFLHINDLYQLLLLEISDLPKYNGEIFNVGGGHPLSLSLLEMTGLLEEITGKKTAISAMEAPSRADIPYFISDASKISKISGWSPRIGIREIFEDICRWIQDNRESLAPILG